MTAPDEDASTTTTSTTTTPAPGANLHYLNGDTIYLRGVEPDDAKWGMAWWPNRFPIAAETLEEQLKKQAPQSGERGSTRLIICRRSDGRLVGSAVIDESAKTEAYLWLHADPTLGPAGDPIRAEALRLLVPWLAGERFRPIVITAFAEGDAALIAAAQGLGMRPSVMLREGAWRHGQRRDQHWFEYPNPVWIERVGDPGIGIEAALPAPTNPVPRKRGLTDVPMPQNSFLGSERLALRPFNQSDAELVSRLVRQESDGGFGHSRIPISQLVFNHWFGEMSSEPISSEMEVAVILRDSGEIIGEVGLYDIDWIGRHAETGSWLYRPEYRGGGYGTEAKLLLLEYAFEVLGLNMLWSWVKELNPRSQAALRKQGYRDAGITHWSGFGPEGFEHARMFDLLASEWFAGQR
ncbi:MAG: GNAT family N-acetyltransferase [Thermomicrobiales bacterium]